MNKAEKLAREYNLFGPWLLQVQTDEDISETFLPHCDISEAEFAFKIPHAIDRRDAQPGDALYDYLVLLSNQEMTVLQRQGEMVHRQVLSYRDIVALVVTEELLRGELLVVSAGQRILVPFNTVSEDIIRSTVELLRKKISGGPPGGTGARKEHATAGTPGAMEEMNQLDRNLFRKEGQNGAVELLAYQPFVSLKRRSESLFQRTVDLVRRPALRSAMVIATPRDLVLYRSLPQTVTYRRGNYRYSRTVIPCHLLQSLSLRPNSEYIGCVELAFELPGFSPGMTVDEQFDTAALAERLQPGMPVKTPVQDQDDGK